MARLEEITGKAVSGEWGDEDTDGNGVPVLRTTNFTNDGTIDFTKVVTRSIRKDAADKLLRPGDIIIEKSGGSDAQPVGRVVFYEGPEKTYLFNNFTGLLRVRDSSAWIPKYVFYALFANYVRGGTRPYENRTTGIHNLQIANYVADTAIPDKSRPEQEKIVSVLDKLNDLIGVRKRQLAKLDELVKARFIERFGNPIVFEQAEYSLQLGDVCILKAGTFVKAEDIRQEDGQGLYPCFGGNGRRGYVSGYTHDGEFPIIGRQGALCGNIQYARGKFHATEHAVVVTPRTPMDRYWLYYMLKLMNLNRYAKGAAQPGLAVQSLEKIHVQIPELAQQKSFSNLAHQVDKSKSAVQRGLKKLETLKAALMQQYFG